MSETPRAYTPEEARDLFLEHIRCMVDYWATVKGRTEKEKLSGLAFSILVTLDGGTNLPAFDAIPVRTGKGCHFDIVPCPHPTDKDYCKDNGENWFEPVPLPGTLHELFYRREE
jgi:hypothetical protein